MSWFELPLDKTPKPSRTVVDVTNDTAGLGGSFLDRRKCERASDPQFAGVIERSPLVFVEQMAPLVNEGANDQKPLKVRLAKRFVHFAILVLATTSCSGNDTVAPPVGTASPVPPTSTAVAQPKQPTSSPTATVVSTTALAPTTSGSVTTAAPDQTIDELLGDSVRAYFDVRLDANGPPQPNPDDPRLAEVATGAELDKLVANTAARLDAGEAIRSGDNKLADVRVGFVEVVEDTATLSACSVDDEVVFKVETGAVLDDAVVTHNYVVDLLLLDDRWKITKILRVQQWEGVSGCALAAADYPF